jgi:hypothetical protein
MPVRLLPLLLALLALCLVPASPAGASVTQESVFEDDFELLQNGSAARNRALDDMDRLGADVIRSLVLWNQVAPGYKKKKRPKGFDAADPAAYNPAMWDRYDDLVRGANARGLAILFSPSGPIPAWASDCGGSVKSRRVCKPKPTEFGKFVQALGTRYSGTYADENQGGGVLPGVDRWSIWNEPNQPGWLMPQYESRSGRRVASAAHRYRALARSAIAGLRRSGHGAEQILLGETAPIGRTSGTLARRPIPPVEFIRELFCLKSNGRKMTGTQARLASCRRPGKLAVSGFAHHPYTRGGSQPPRAKVLPGEITVSTSGRLKTLLKQGARAGRIPGSLPIHYTEFGYQTNPPDRLFGVTENEQSRYINEADWIAYNDSRVLAVAQYKLVDEPNVSSFQTGLRFLDGTAKAAYDAYRLPLWVRKRSGGLRVYGQVRPADDGARELVDLQHRADSESNFVTVQTIEVSSPKGHFVVDVPAGAGQWRLRWAPARGGAALFSREAEAASR